MLYARAWLVPANKSSNATNYYDSTIEATSRMWKRAKALLPKPA